MSKSGNSFYPAGWIKSAEKDWHRVSTMLGDDDLEGAAFFLQQALEKYLKAFLLHKGWKLRKIHDLDALLDDAVKQNSNLESYRALCKRVAGYYLTERYPSVAPSGLLLSDIEQDIKEAKRFIEAIHGKEM